MTVDHDIERRAEQAVRRILRLGPDVPLRMGSTPGWDSMGHMNVVMEIEKEFKTTFPPYRLPELVDIESIVKAVSGAGLKR